MTMPDEGGVTTTDQALMKAFLLDARERMSALREARTALETDATDRAAWDQVRHAGHTIAGNASMMGFDALAQVARNVERRTAGLMRDLTGAAGDVVGLDDECAVLRRLIAAIVAAEPGGRAAFIALALGPADLPADEVIVTSHRGAAETRILIVDDEHPVLEAVSEYLAAYGFAVDAAQELEEAEALLATTPYGVMIADVRLSGTHGREGLELIRFARHYAPDIRVIVMTAHAAGDLELEARRRGADAFVEKPLPLSDLMFEVRRVLGTGSPPCPSGTCRDG